MEPCTKSYYYFNPDWTDNDVKTMEILYNIVYCLPLIKFYSLSSKDFLRKVCPYKKLLKHQLYEDLLVYHLDPESETTHNILPPRISIGKCDSKIININTISLISTWIDKDKVVTNSKFAYKRGFYLPYEFKLLLRGSRDGFTPKTFHSLCDEKPKTVTFIKVNGTEEILGGYNPLTWKSINNWGKCEDSFIFSFKIKNNSFNDAIFSNVKNESRALRHGSVCGPSFGLDLRLQRSDSDGFKDYNYNFCRKKDYEKKIRDTESYFSIEDYEVFQILGK